MLQIDRMEIEDAGGNPEKLAQAVLKQLPDLSRAIPVREVARAVDIYEIREENLVGLEGGLVTPDDRSEGAILVNAARPEVRKRYTIAHELGHYLNPWHKSSRVDGFRCRSRDLAMERFDANDRAAQMEVEANQFAAELLMPAAQVAAFLRRSAGIDIGHILRMGERFEVSREAAARRYIAMLDEAAAVVFSKDGVIRYLKKHQYFPALSVRAGEPLPTPSLSCKRSLPVGQVSDWNEFDGGIWLLEPKGRRVCEQTIAQQNGFRLTLVALEAEDVDEDEDEDDSSDWRPPVFRR